ncbi:hypothetical protein JNUCC83_12060 [Vagococcus sp. JNUCC 83]
MDIKGLITYYTKEVDKMLHEKKEGYIDDFETDWTRSLYLDFIQKLKELDEYNQKK